MGSFKGEASYLLRRFPIADPDICHEGLRPKLLISWLVLERVLVHRDHVRVCHLG